MSHAPARPAHSGQCLRGAGRSCVSAWAAGRGSAGAVSAPYKTRPPLGIHVDKALPSRCFRRRLPPGPRRLLRPHQHQAGAVQHAAAALGRPPAAAPPARGGAPAADPREAPAAAAPPPPGAGAAVPAGASASRGVPLGLSRGCAGLSPVHVPLLAFCCYPCSDESPTATGSLKVCPEPKGVGVLALQCVRSSRTWAWARPS